MAVRPRARGAAVAIRERAPLKRPAPTGDPILADPWGRGPADARLAGYGTPVWALVAYYLGGAGREAARVASDYGLPQEAVAAALAYFAAHREPILARLALNDAA
jgi:uncharacterized protein (DUF433 family)